MKHCISLILLCCGLVRAYSQGTAFTYQGRLTDGANPVNGLYDFRFALYDAASEGGAVGGVLTNAATGVSNGLFTATLQFGSGLFTGAERWLEIAARPAGGGAFTRLEPRQQILATPYAMTAREVTGSVAAQQLIGIIQPANIGAGSITSIMIAPGSIHSNLLAAGSVHSNALVIGSIHSNHLAVGSVHSNALALGAIHSNHLAAGSVHSNALALGTIHSNHLAAGSIHSNALAVGSIHSNHLSAGSIHSNALALGSVTATALAARSIHSNHLAAGSVHSNALVIGSIHSNHLAVGSVHSNALVIGAIHSNHLAVGSIHSNHLSAGSVHSNALALGTIHSNHLAVGSIHSNHLGVASIHSNHLAAGSVHSNALALGSITASALATGSIHSNHLSAGSIHSNALALGSVTATALASGSIHSNHLAVGSVHSNALVIGAIHSNHLAVGSIHSNHLSAGSIHSNALALGSVTATALATGSIHSNHLAAGSVHSNALVIGSIHSNHLAAGSVHSNALALGSVTATALAAGTIHSNHLAAGSVDSTALVIGSIHSNHLAVGAVSLDSLSTARSSSFPITLSNPNPGFFEYYGVAVAGVGTDKLLIGEYEDSTGGDNVGAAHLVGLNGSLLHTFLSPAPQNQAHFGIAVAALGQNHVLIGAEADDTGANDAGTAYLFSVNGTLVTTFTNPTPAVADFFGSAVAAVGTDKVLIGAHGDHFGGNAGGAAYLFSTNRTLLATFNNPTPSSGDRFGVALAAVGPDHVLIGADRDDQGATDAGVAYLFHVDGWLVTTITNPTPALNEAFGFALAGIDANKVVIGAHRDNSGGNLGGAVYLFDTSGTLLATIANPTPASDDQFGFAVAAMGSDRVLIGAASDDNGATDGGAAYLFSTSGALLNTFNNPAPGTGDLFGSAVTAVGADRVLIGAFQDDANPTDSGAAYLFTLNAYVPGLVLDPAMATWTKAGANTFFNGGNVGIGTSNPEYRLDVAGPVRITSFGHGAEVLNLSTERSWAFRQFGTGAATALELASIGGGGNKNFIINTTGLVGIGTTSPQATLQVSGNNSHLRLHDTGRGNYWNIYTENHPNQAVSGNLLFVPGPAGVFGFIQKSTGNYFSGSDERLKTDIHSLSGVLDRLLQLRPVSYRFKTAPPSVPPTIGLIAQEVELLFPEVVTEHDGMKALAYSELVPVTVGAIQELNRKLTDELKQQATEITELRQSVDELKTLVNALSRKLNRGGQ